MDDLGRRVGLTLLLGIAALIAAALAYGAWRAHGHADLSLVLNDLSLRDARRVWGELREGQLVLRDKDGVALATARFTAPDGVLRYSGHGAVDCASVEAQSGPDWQRCAKARSAWIAGWVDRAISADVRSAGCTIADVPLQRRVYSDWWLWWVPLTHVGGSPSRLVSLTAFIDAKRCVAVSPAP